MAETFDSVGSAILEKLAKIEDKQDRMERLLEKRIAKKTWLTKEEAMQELDCKRSKLYQLVNAGKIRVNDDPARGKSDLKYSAKSIQEYLDNPRR